MYSKLFVYNTICTCNSGYYDSDGGGSTGTCVPKIAAGLNCAGLPVDACTPNSLCTNNICTCNSGFYDSDGGGSTGTCVPKIALSGTCNNGLGVTQCWTSGAVCATDNKCRCASGTFDDNGFGTADGVCRDMSLLIVTGIQASNLGTNSVTISWTAPATYSSQVTRYEVTWTSPTQSGGSMSAGIATSLTVTGFVSNTQYSFTVQTVESGSQTSEQLVSSSALPITTLSPLGGACGTCADSNAICSSATCICNTGYYDNNGNTLGGTCVSKVGPGISCAGLPPDACSTNSVCSNNRCTCNSGFYDSDGSGSTLGTCVPTIALSGSCNSGLVGVTQCSNANAECTGDFCRCMTGYFDSNGFSTTGGTCTAMSTLKVTGVSVTTQGTDTAIVTWTPPTDASQVNNYQVIWSPAKGDGTSSYNAGIASTATISGFTSGSIYTFNVKTVESGSRTTALEVESNSPYKASMKAALSVACGAGSPEVVCEDTTTASCTLNICRCNVGYFDSNGYGTSGGVCTAMSNLKVTSVTSSLVTATSVTISWTPPTDSSQISGYVVVATISNSGSVEGTYYAANTATSRAIAGLTSGTTYVFTVKSREMGSRTTTQEIESDVSVTVTTKVELTETCGGGLVCDDANSECIAGNSGGTVCRCQSGYYDSNGYSTAGGVCTSISGLVVTSFMVGVEGTSTVALDWSAPSHWSDQVNRYEVHWTPALANGTTNYNAEKTTSVKLTGFVSGQTYSFYVKSIELGSRATEQEVQTTAKDITINAGLGVVCTGGIQCADSNAECIQNNDGTDNVCRCKSTYFDSNSYSTSGGMCVTMSTLAVTGLTLTKEGTNTVNISWSPPLEYRNQVNRYEVHWTPSTTIYGNTFYNAQLNTAVQLVGFVPGQTYTFFVRSVESGSRSQEQNYDTTASPITMKPSTASGFTATDIEGPEIILSWSLPSGSKTRYDVTTTPALSPTTTFTESITYTSNVLNGHRYNISITTVSGSEQSDPLLATFRTVSTTPNPPTGLTCTTITDTSITLTWTAPVVPNGDIQHYIVNSITTTAFFPTSTSITEYTVKGLLPETTYTFSVATVNDAVKPYHNQSVFSSVIGCPTKAAMSLEPNTSVVSQLQSRQFTLNWTKPLITNGDLWGYRLTVSDETTCVWEVLFTCTSCPGYMAFVHECSVGTKQTVIILPADLDSYTYTVDTLLPYTNYTVSVLAVNAGGNGHPNTQYVMTEHEDADLGSACNGGSIQCSDPNAYCTQTDNRHTSVCRCKSTHVDSNGINLPGGFCVARMYHLDLMLG